MYTYMYIRAWIGGYHRVALP